MTSKKPLLPSRNPRTRTVRAALALAGVSALASCAAGSTEDPAPDLLGVWETGAATLSVGTLDGEETQEFGGIQGVISTPGGGLAVSDAVTGRVSLFDSEGEFVRTIGGPGEGPGEFGLLSRIYAHGSDSIAALDQRRTMVSWFSLDGEFGRMAPASEVSGETLYEMDVFPASRYIVDGAVDARTRIRVGRTASLLPQPTGESLVRLLKVAADGGLWVQEVAGDSATASEWLVLTGDGRPDRWVRLPADFTPFEIEGDEVVGRRVGEYGVEYAERYPLVSRDETHPVPAWFTPDLATADGGEAVQPMTASDLRDEALLSIKTIATGQEIFYSTNFRYARSFDELMSSDIPEDLRDDLPEEFEFRFLTSGQRGWAMVLAHPEVSTVCTLGYGIDTPPGWGKGSVDCGSVDGIGGSPPPWATGDKPPAGKSASGGKD